MQGSPTTPGRSDTRAIVSNRIAFRVVDRVGTQDIPNYAAQWLAFAHPCRRFACILADADARLGAVAGHYSFNVADFHRLLLASLLAHRQSGWMSYCLIQECSRAGRALPHPNAPDATSVCQSIARVLLCRPSRRDPNRLSCSIGEPAFPSRPGAAQATARNGGDWEERSHPQPHTARSCARAWRGWRAPDLPRSEHRGTLPPVEDRASAHPLQSVTSRNRRHAYGVRRVERCLPRHLSRGCPEVQQNISFARNALSAIADRCAHERGRPPPRNGHVCHAGSGSIAESHP
jgi:hypothetical protein